MDNILSREKNCSPDAFSYEYQGFGVDLFWDGSGNLQPGAGSGSKSTHVPVHIGPNLDLL